MTAFINLLRCELALHFRHRAEWASLFMFFGIVVILMPFALGPEPALLCRLSPGLIWIACLLMILLGLDRLFVQDARDGTLDLMLTSALPLPLSIFAKLSAQMVAMLLALGAMLLPAAILLGMTAHTIPILMATIVLGLPSLILLGGIAGAITVALHRGAALLTLLLVPFYIPLVIFAVSACDASLTGASPAQPLLFMGAILALLLPSAPFIIAGALRDGQG